jgi:tRNA pseudouridine55 synthase
VDQAQALAVRHGQRLAAGGIDGTYGVFDQDGHAIALAVDDGSTARPLVVLTPA